ncbi:hypothetical protein L798_10832 [Zootermopsis nevadensis]|uniref:Uncharacterized protein n=1 Tax=Zootermopsis nevadensis TaxID=136037 RepID=A0A067R9V3_ZOONE|nr:hypothetical protein L798_10832 [Zootermopsis nevadensis]
MVQPCPWQLETKPTFREELAVTKRSHFLALPVEKISMNALHH